MRGLQTNHEITCCTKRALTFSNDAISEFLKIQLFLFYVNFPGSAPQNQSTITPTVELNALDMKRGEKAEYTPIETPRNNFTQPAYDYRYPFNQR
jgi:hypothetical protein